MQIGIKFAICKPLRAAGLTTMEPGLLCSSIANWTVYLPRAISDACLAAAEQFPVLLVTGPRQVGKTTMLQRLAGKERRYVSLDDPAARLLARNEPALFLERYEP